MAPELIQDAILKQFHLCLVDLLAVIAAALSPDISFARAAFTYAKPAATQQRTLALIRTGDKSGFYFDVFRSKAADPAGEFHDYLYHNMGTLGAVSVPLASSATLAEQKGVLKGYSYFKNEKSASVEGDMKATFALDLPGSPSMNLWIPGQQARTVFTVDAPLNNAIRDAISPNMRGTVMPTIIVRQTGEAWQRPFVAVYEPFLLGKNTIQNVSALRNDAPTLAATVVEGKDCRVLLLQDANPDAARNVGGTFVQADFAVVIERGGQAHELYLGNGKLLESGGWRLEADQPASVSLRRTADGWVYGSTGAVKINGQSLPAAREQRLDPLTAGHAP